MGPSNTLQPMKPTSDKFEPRRDGWFQHEGTWEEVTIGTVIESRADPRQRWEVIDTSMPSQVQHARTLLMRIREQTTGEEHTIQPRLKTNSVTILTQDPGDTQTAPPTPPTNAEAMALLAKELGAEAMATFDHDTGEVVCPDYINAHHKGSDGSLLLPALIEHMRLAHAMSVGDDLTLAPAITLHGQAHNPKWPHIGKGGFSHRHIPEDLAMYVGRKR